MSDEAKIETVKRCVDRAAKVNHIETAALARDKEARALALELGEDLIAKHEGLLFYAPTTETRAHRLATPLKLQSTNNSRRNPVWALILARQLGMKYHPADPSREFLLFDSVLVRKFNTHFESACPFALK